MEATMLLGLERDDHKDPFRHPWQSKDTETDMD